jgi:septation ring formation regulator EzrA
VTREELLLDANRRANLAIADIANECAGYAEKLKEALKWKEEDPRMLREQIRVADAAYNFLHGEHRKLQKRLEEAETIFQNIIDSCAHPDKAFRAVMVNLEPLRNFLKETNAQKETGSLDASASD